MLLHTIGQQELAGAVSPIEYFFAYFIIQLPLLTCADVSLSVSAQIALIEIKPTVGSTSRREFRQVKGFHWPRFGSWSRLGAPLLLSFCSPVLGWCWLARSSSCESSPGRCAGPLRMLRPDRIHRPCARPGELTSYLIERASTIPRLDYKKESRSGAPNLLHERNAANGILHLPEFSARCRANRSLIFDERDLGRNDSEHVSATLEEVVE